MAKEKHSETKSHRVGRATLATGAVTTAYHAVVAFECILCARMIAPGEFFSRRTRHTPTGVMGRPTTDPVCNTCRPLRLEDTGKIETAATDARED